MYSNIQNIDHVHIATIVLSCLSYESRNISSLRTILKLHILLNAPQKCRNSSSRNSNIFSWICRFEYCGLRYTFTFAHVRGVVRLSGTHTILHAYTVYVCQARTCML